VRGAVQYLGRNGGQGFGPDRLFASAGAGPPFIGRHPKFPEPRRPGVVFYGIPAGGRRRKPGGCEKFPLQAHFANQG